MKQVFSIAVLSLPLAAFAQGKPAITLDEFLNTTSVRGAEVAPDGSAVVVGIDAPDWKHDRYSQNLWLWKRADGKLTPLTASGHDGGAKWSPDGTMIAFASDRTLSDDDGDGKDKDGTARVWLISAQGGEAKPLYREKLDMHTFAWSADGTKILLSATEVTPKAVEDARVAEWKDVIRWREQEHGDVLLAVPVAGVLQAVVPPLPHLEKEHPEKKAADDKPEYPEGAVMLAHSGLTIDELAPAPSGKLIAFETAPVSHRLENPAETELFVVDAAGGEPKQLTHNQGLEGGLTWTPDSKRIDVLVRAAGGSIEGPYQDVQGRLYSLDATTGAVARLGGDFKGSWEDLAVMADGTVLAVGSTGISQQLYRLNGATSKAVGTVPGSYGHLSVAERGSALAFTHSAIGVPTQVFVASDLAGVNEAKAISAFNPVFAERAPVEWRPYQWKSVDGTTVEGVLLYPAGKKDAKGMRMLTLIHGGPADADGNRFGADWYDYAFLAASQGWVVFRPNYRGSTGYGDAFQLGIMPHLVSVPGQDILAGVDALVKDGVADPDKLAIGGYSYGGYMTNWIITQTTRFKAAATGAGAVEHAANWGNDDLTFDDAWYLSGAPWERPQLYQSEAALFQLNKVKTPTHIVGGNADDRVSYLEEVLMERGLQRLGVPHSLLVFPGENHPLSKNPWHGYIKLRDELKWLDTYDPK